jgi:hypothetical protein
MALCIKKSCILLDSLPLLTPYLTNFITQFFKHIYKGGRVESMDRWNAKQ